MCDPRSLDLHKGIAQQELQIHNLSDARPNHEGSAVNNQVGAKTQFSGLVTSVPRGLMHPLLSDVYAFTTVMSAMLRFD